MPRAYRVVTLRMLAFLLLLAPAVAVSSCKTDGPQGKTQQQKVRMLGWVGYEEEDLLKAVKDATGIQVTVENFIGGSEMLSKLEADPSRYDVVVLDPEYISVAHDRSLLEVLNTTDFDFEQYHPLFRNLKQTKINGELYAVPVRFGVIGILYNAERVPEADVRRYGTLLKPEYRNRISVMDLWQPVMGVMSLSLGHEQDPYNVADAEFAAVKARLMEFKGHGVVVHTKVPDLITSLSTETTWIMLGGGEANAASLRDKGKKFRWTVPQEGGIIWVESRGIARGTPRKSASVEVIKFLQSPQGQALLARRNTYISSPPSVKALQFLSPEELEIRCIPTQEAMNQLLSRVVVRTLPKEPLVRTWISAWEEFKR